MADDGEQVTLILPSGNKQAFLIPSGMSDNEAKLYVRSKRPDLFKTPEEKAPDALAQARQKIANIPQFTSRTDELRANLANAQSGVGPQGKQYNDYMKQSGQFAGTVAGVMATGGLSRGRGILKLLGRSGASGAGAGVGSLAGGANPPEAAASAVGGAIAQPIAEGIGAAVSPLARWLGASKSLGAKALQAASAKAGNAPVPLSPQTDEIVDKIVQQGKLGGRIPKVITDLLDRLGPSTRQAADATPGPLTYDEARILQSNASQLSVNELNDLKGQLKSLIPDFAKSFGKDVQAAADAAGAGAEHAIGMREYAAASARNRALANAGKAAKPLAKGALGATGAAGVYELYRMLTGQR